MNYQSLPLIIGQLSAVDIVLLAVVIVLFLFGRKIPGMVSSLTSSVRTVKNNIDIVRGAQSRGRHQLAPAVRKRFVSEGER